MKAPHYQTLLSFLLLWSSLFCETAMSAVTRPSAKFFLELDGKPVAILSSFSGGPMIGEVNSLDSGFSCCFPPKFLIAIHPDELVMEVPGLHGSDLVEWIQKNLQGDLTEHNGSIVLVDQNFRVIQRINFLHGLISEISFPALRATARIQPPLKLKIMPEQAQVVTGNDEIYRTILKNYQSSSFRLDIAGIDTSRVSAIDAITIKRTFMAGDTGEQRPSTGMIPTGNFEISPLSFTIAGANARDLEKWHEDFVVNGNNSDDRELEGTITLLANNVKVPPITLSLHHLGIYRLLYSSSTTSTGADEISVRAMTYIEGVSLPVEDTK